MPSSSSVSEGSFSNDFEESEEEEEAAETVESQGGEEEEEDEKKSSGGERAVGSKSGRGGKVTLTQYDLIIQQLIAHDRNNPEASLPSFLA